MTIVSGQSKSVNRRNVIQRKVVSYGLVGPNINIELYGNMGRGCPKPGSS